MSNANSELNLSAAKIIEQSDVSAANPFGSVPAPPTAVRKKVIRKMKKAASFERRFLSARGKSANLCLEVAVIWRDTVLSIQQFKAGHAEISVGSGKDCTYHVDNHTANGKVCLAQYVNNHWEILFNHACEGFILKGEKKTEFASASTADFAIPSTNSSLMPGSLACTVDGDVRAKFVFGEVSILIHYVDAVALPMPLLGGFKVTNYAPLAASIVLHLALFSIIFLATDRVNALMVDRIISSSRFVTEIEVPDDVVKPNIMVDPPEPDTIETPTKIVDEGANKPVLAPSSDGNSVGQGSSTGRSNAESEAMRAGLLNQANLMSSLIAAGPNMDDFRPDWNHFDSGVAMENRDYGITATGTLGGGDRAGYPGLFGPDGVGPNGQRITSKLDNTSIGIPERPGVEPPVPPRPPVIDGSMDARIIRKVVRDHNGELRACYERQLMKTKGLNGRIVITWVITPRGDVSKTFVKETTMKNKEVESCIENSIKFWKFPAPKNGGTVMVDYPFVFEVSGNK